MSDQRRVSQRTQAVLARRRLEEKAKKVAAKKGNKRPVAASRSTDEETVFAEIPEPCVDGVNRGSNADTREMAAMDEAVYQDKVSNIAKLVNMVDVAITDYGEGDVELHDVVSEEYKTQLGYTREKYEKPTEEICNVMADLKDSELDV